MGNINIHQLCREGRLTELTTSLAQQPNLANEFSEVRFNLTLSLRSTAFAFQDGETPLIIAVSVNRYDVAEFLLTRGADVKLCSKVRSIF